MANYTSDPHYKLYKYILEHLKTLEAKDTVSESDLSDIYDKLHQLENSQGTGSGVTQLEFDDLKKRVEKLEACCDEVKGKLADLDKMKQDIEDLKNRPASNGISEYIGKKITIKPHEPDFPPVFYNMIPTAMNGWEGWIPSDISFNDADDNVITSVADVRNNMYGDGIWVQFSYEWLKNNLLWGEYWVNLNDVNIVDRVQSDETNEESKPVTLEENLDQNQPPFIKYLSYDPETNTLTKYNYDKTTGEYSVKETIKDYYKKEGND